MSILFDLIGSITSFAQVEIDYIDGSKNTIFELRILKNISNPNLKST